MGIVLIVATILGGIAAIWFFYDKFSSENEISGENEFSVENKTVNNNWWESSELKKCLEAEGYNTFAWSNSDRVEERIDEGYEVIFDEDKDNKIKYKLVNKSAQVLIGRKNT